MEYDGTDVASLDGEDLFARAIALEPRHPYSKALMSAFPVPGPAVERRRQRIVLAGDLPSPAAPPPGCRFHTRCPFRQETRCDTERPQLRVLAPDHRVACHWAEEIAAGTIRPHEVTAEDVAAAEAGLA